jgi:hypothetical protein
MRAPLMKNISLSTLAYEMLVEAARKKRMKPSAFIEQLIHSAYNQK